MPKIARLISLAFLALFLTGCRAVVPTASPTDVLLPTPTLTPTAVPVAFLVNGEAVSRAEFDSEVSRYLQSQADLGRVTDPEEAARIVRDDLIDQILLAQEANRKGFVADDAALQARIDALAGQVGGMQVLEAWEEANGYSDAEFRSSLRRQMAAAWMRDQILSEVPRVADQVHVRQILFTNEKDAQNVYTLLQSGWTFDDLSDQYDPVTKGELGWFPRGYLVHPTIEEAAFSLQPGEYSPVVASSVGFHILYLVERDPARVLSSDALLTLQEHALDEWLTKQRNASTIVIEP